MTKKSFNNFFLISLIIVYAFLINWFSGNRGVMPIDTFGFFDTGYVILKGKLPIRDYWIFTGLVVDYMQALFFWIFGLSWKSYIFHSSFINVLTTISFFYFLKIYDVNKYLNFLYCISFATLFYPVSGTPFAYLHSFAFSLIAVFIFLIAIKNENYFMWFSLPFLFLISFFSMQTPSVYIIITLLIILFYYFIKYKNFKNLKFFIFGIILNFGLFLLFLIITKTNLRDLIYQYFLFPITIGESRILSEINAYVRLEDQLNLKKIFGDFKFIHFFLVILIFLIIVSFNKKKNNLFLLNILGLTSIFLFIFNQINQANQIYIFSLIPVTAAFVTINLKNFEIKNYKSIIFFLVIILLLSTIKMHFRYNVERKFLDIERFDKSLAVNASQIDKKLEHLKWISFKFKDPAEEIDLIKFALNTLKSDSRKKIVVTHYQFLSTILEEDLNILNRWYLWDGNTHPTENHKYFSYYKELINKIYKKNEPKVLYLLGFKEKHFVKIKKYFDNKCFNKYTLIENYFYKYDFVNCRDKI